MANNNLNILLTKIKQLIDSTYKSNQSAGIVHGVVTNISPLVIDFDEIGELSGRYIVCGSICRKYEIMLPNGSLTEDDKWFESETSYDTITASGSAVFATANGQVGITLAGSNSAVTASGKGGTDGHKHNINATKVIVWNGLQVGDNVLAFRYDGGDKYYIADVLTRTNNKLENGEELL